MKYQFTLGEIKHCTDRIKMKVSNMEAANILKNGAAAQITWTINELYKELEGFAKEQEPKNG